MSPRRTVAWFGSAAVHAALFLTLWWTNTPSPSVAADPIVIEFAPAQLSVRTPDAAEPSVSPAIRPLSAPPTPSAPTTTDPVPAVVEQPLRDAPSTLRSDDANQSDSPAREPEASLPSRQPSAPLEGAAPTPAIPLALQKLRQPASTPPFDRSSVITPATRATAAQALTHHDAMAGRPGLPDGLRPLPNGGYEYFDPNRLFVATVLPNGRVEIESQTWATAEMCAVVLCASVGRLREPGEKKRRWSQLNPQLKFKFKAKGDRRVWRPGEFGEMRTPPPLPVLLSGGFGRPPDPTRAVAVFLERTFDFRLRLSTTDQRRHLVRELRQLDHKLAVIWTDPKRSAPEKRELLFALWRECDVPLDADDAPSDLPTVSDADAIRQRAALEARRRIERFVREHAPLGSADAYTDVELAQMNAGAQASQRFSPYTHQNVLETAPVDSQAHNRP